MNDSMFARILADDSLTVSSVPASTTVMAWEVVPSDARIIVGYARKSTAQVTTLSVEPSADRPDYLYKLVNQIDVSDAWYRLHDATVWLKRNSIPCYAPTK